jgi:hypothetical protein
MATDRVSALRAAVAGMVVLPLAGCFLYFEAPYVPFVGGHISSTIFPLDLNPEPNMDFSYRGESASYCLIGLAAWGECTISAAALQGQLDRVDHVDAHYTNILGLWRVFKTVAHGPSAARDVIKAAADAARLEREAKAAEIKAEREAKAAELKEKREREREEREAKRKTPRTAPPASTPVPAPSLEQVDPLPVPPVSPSVGDVQKRLTELQQLRDAGLISEAEYQAKRAEILGSL